MISSERPAYLAGHAGNVIEPANASLVLELTLDAGQRLTRPAAHNGILLRADPPRAGRHLGGFRSPPGMGFTGLRRGIVMVIGCPGWRLARRWCR